MKPSITILGAGPAGSVAAARLAADGRPVLLLEKTPFPRHKVCGDCLNPAAWPILDSLGLRDRVHALPHVRACAVEFLGIQGQRIRLTLPAVAAPELIVPRRDLDQLLVDRAIEAGAEFRDGVTVTSLTRTATGWTLATSAGKISTPILLAADGRNSTVARLAGRLGRARHDRVALQAHVPLDPSLGDTIRMIFHPGGYGGLARINATEMNLCLVARTHRLTELRAHAETLLHAIAPDLPPPAWRSITPLTRADSAPLAADGLFLLGDTARVVEPFTGEGITYAIQSGDLAARCLLENPTLPAAEAAYRHAHPRLYRGRLWINRLARLASLHPQLTSHLLTPLRLNPAPLSLLTAKIIRPRPAQS